MSTRSLSRACALLGAAFLVISAAQFGLVQAASPGQGKLDPTHKTLSEMDRRSDGRDCGRRAACLVQSLDVR